MAKPTYAVEAQGLVKRYIVGGLLRPKKVIEALRGVSFRVPRGTVFSLLGPNGAGKTTTINILATLLEPDGGEARILGFDVVRERWEVRKRIGVLLSVERGFFWKLTARENLIYFGMIYGLSGRALRERVEELLDLVGLNALGASDRLFEEMSLGMKARLGLARALLRDPEVLLLDEPTLGLDPPSSVYVRRLLRRLAEKGKTVILTTHNMYEAEVVSDRVAIIVGGRIVVEGTPQELKRMVAKKVPVEVRLRGDLYDGGEGVRKDLVRVLGRPVALKTYRESGVLEVRVVAEPGEEERVVEKVLRVSQSRGFRVVEAKVLEPSLEDVFIVVTGSGGSSGSG